MTSMFEDIWLVNFTKNHRQYNNQAELKVAIPQAKGKSLFDNLPRRTLALCDAKAKHKN